MWRPQSNVSLSSSLSLSCPVWQHTKKVENTRDRVPGQPWVAASMDERTKSKRPLVDRKCENKRSRSQEAAPAAWVKSSVYGSNMSKVVMWFSASSRVSRMKVWKRMHLSLSLPVSTCWCWGEAQQEVEKREYSRSSFRFCAKIRSKVVFLNTKIQWSPFYGRLEKWDWTLLRDTLKFSGRTWYEIRIRDRTGPSRGVIQEGELHELNLCAPRFEERTPEETWRQVCHRKAAWNLARKIDKLTNADKATLYSLVETRAAVLVSRIAEECLFVDSGASMRLLSKKDLIPDEMAPSRRSIDPTTVMTASEEVQTIEGAQVYVHDLDLVVTEQLLENTPSSYIAWWAFVGTRFARVNGVPEAGP